MKLLAIAGMATVGKDEFCRILLQRLNEQGHKAKRFAIADELKLKVRQPLLELSGIDVLNCSAEEKSLIRDYLVAVGKIKRQQTEGKYWTNKLEQKLEMARVYEGVEIAVVTDVRYDFFPEDEIYWTQKKMGGTLIHLSRYVTVDPEDIFDYHNNPYLKTSDSGELRLFVQPPNEDERINDPKLKAKADYVCEWSTTPAVKGVTDPEERRKILDAHCLPYVDKFIESLLRNTK